MLQLGAQGRLNTLCVSDSETLAVESPQVFRIFRLFRLARVFRATRILEHSPELLTLAWGVFAGIRSVCAVLSLLLLMIYIFGVVFTMVLRDTEVWWLSNGLSIDC